MTDLYLNNDHRKRLAVFYFLCFAIYFAWYFFHGLLMQQWQPVFFHNKLDLTANIIWFTDLQHQILHSSSLRIVLDSLFLALPLSLCLAFYLNFRSQYWLSIITSVFNLLYAVLLSSVTPLSIEGFTGWILLPLMFAFKTDRSFYFAMHSMRYYFLLIFFSAGLWKLRAGGIFNTEQMSAILLDQHASYLVGAPDDWFSRLIKYLVIHKNLSYALYLLAAISELIFVIGFFTKKLDRLLILIFVFFVIFDYFLMRINYFSWIAFLGCLWYSKLPPSKTQNG
jgi:hypothetical protein